MQKEENEQEIAEGMIEIFLAKEELQGDFHQMISALIVRELVIGRRIVLKGDAEMAEVVQEIGVKGTEIEVSEVIEVIEETETIEVIEEIDGI
jgi:hypothetical protein